MTMMFSTEREGPAVVKTCRSMEEAVGVEIITPLVL